MILAACAALLLGIFFYVFSVPRTAEEQHQKTRLEFLRERKDVVYDNLRDLNFENSAGKYPEEDYNAQRTLLENEAAEILAEMEALEAMTDADSAAV
ncbi:MAG TPA: hypothetical protein VMU62_00790 [Acidobacteriaceae bacterium]|nr:hypothetical protein [Acidobacteriaceae bacterium]